MLLWVCFGMHKIVAELVSKVGNPLMEGEGEACCPEMSGGGLGFGRFRYVIARHIITINNFLNGLGLFGLSCLE
jgi:hypothetical protein